MSQQYKIRIDIEPLKSPEATSPTTKETLAKLEEAAKNHQIQQALAAATGNSEVKVDLTPQKGKYTPGAASPVAMARSPSPEGEERDYHHEFKYGGSDQSPGPALGTGPSGGFTYKYKYKYLYKYVYKKSDEPLPVDLT